MNRVTIIGKLYEEPTLCRDGKTYRLSIVAPRGRDKTGVFATAFYSPFNGKLSEKIKKDATIMVTGELRTGSYTNKDGIEIPSFVINNTKVETGYSHAGLSTVVLTGNLTSDPEIRRLENGECVASFGVAYNPYYRKDGNWEQGKTSYFNVVAWHHAEYVSQYLKKGGSVVLCGYLSVRKYTDKNNNERTVLEVVADRLSTGKEKLEQTQRQDTKNETMAKDASLPAAQKAYVPQYNVPDDYGVDDEDLPF